MKRNRLPTLCILSASAVFSGNVAAWGTEDLTSLFDFGMGNGLSARQSWINTQNWAQNAKDFAWDAKVDAQANAGILTGELTSVAGSHNLWNKISELSLTQVPGLITDVGNVKTDVSAMYGWLDTTKQNTDSIFSDVSDIHWWLFKADETGRLHQIWARTTQIPAIATDVTNVKNDVTGIVTDLGLVKTTVETVSTTVNLVETEVGLIKADVAGMVSDVTNVKDDVTGMVTDLGLVKTTVDTLSTSVDLVETGIETVTTTVALVNTSVDTLSTAVELVETEVTSLKADVTGIVTDLGLVKTTVDTVSTSVNAVETGVGDVATSVGQVDDKLVSLGSDVGAVGTDVKTAITDLGVIDTALNSGILSINDQIDLALDAIDRVETVIADPNLTTAFDILATDGANIVTNITDVGTTVTSLKDDVSGVVTDMAAVQSAVNALTSSVDAVESGVGATVTAVGQVDDKLVSLGSTVGSVGSDVATVIDDLGVIDTALDSGIISINDQISLALGAIDRVETIIANPNLETAFDILATDGAGIVSQLETVVEDVARMQTLVNNVNNVTEQMPIGVDVALSDMLLAAQDLLDFAQATAAEALSGSAGHVDQIALLNAMVNLSNTLKGDAINDIDLAPLINLLEIMPRHVTALTGYGLQLAGIDQTFVAKIQQAVVDVALLQQVIRPDISADGLITADLAGRGYQKTHGSGLPAFISHGSATTCSVVESARGEIMAASLAVTVLGAGSKLTGEILKGIGDTAVKFPTDVELGAHGYAFFKIENDWWKFTGEIIAAIGEALIDISAAAGDQLNHCETIFYQQSILDVTCANLQYQRASNPVCTRWNVSNERAIIRDE